VKYHRNAKNLGAAGNYRRALELATGEYFRWHPSDDLVSPNLLERAVQILDQNPPVFVAYARTKLIDGRGNPLGDFHEGLHLLDDRPSARWKSVHTNLRLGNLPYGLSRTDKLRRTGLLRNYAGGDFPLIAEMSLYGKFYEIPDAFFYRRMHEGASSAMKNSADIMAFFDPNNGQQKVFLHNWTHLGANLKSVSRAPISMAEKLRIYIFQARWVFWSRRAYFHELKTVVSQTAGSSRHS
jgi:glycosyltransferase involved in cell wall biosynthesis